ncbi:hypothetical protein EAS64_10455 [Trebonia kvetii]|uniref:Secreted protein n=1 Tax=Trebonia kvetii TaxID=2480626 RepID=A0A6P2C692_9ACTN|nr:hypothetical protein [Trebonia kvetii]TVZ05033.1 hypothetical protein EAS64_10455 [Trebonia kvetii]
MTSVDARLDQLRGSVPPLSYTARTVAALAANPGCSRRAVLDAAGADKAKIAECAGFPQQSGASQSPFALRRGAVFEAEVKSGGGADVIRLLREKAGLPLPEVSHAVLEEVGGSADLELRWRRTRALLLRAARHPDDAGTLYDHPMLRLEIGGHRAYLEPDVIAFQAAGRFHVIEVKSFALIDGQADEESVQAAALQAAVYIIALQDLFAAESVPAGIVSTDAILVTPEDFTPRATAAFLDVRKQIAILRRQLARMARIGILLEGLPPGLTLDLRLGPDGTPGRPRSEIAAALEAIDARYVPRCLKTCELAAFCRDEARAAGAVSVLGAAARDDLGGLDTIGTALALARGTRQPSADQADITWALRHAMSIASALEGGAA